MTQFIITGARDLIARVKRVIQSRSLITFSDRYMQLGDALTTLAAKHNALEARHAATGDMLALRTTQLTTQRTIADEAAQMCREVGLTIRQRTEERDAAVVVVTKLGGALSSIVKATNAVKVPNGTTRKVRRLATEALA